jgi:hypothetical protein
MTGRGLLTMDCTQHIVAYVTNRVVFEKNLIFTFLKTYLMSLQEHGIQNTLILTHRLDIYGKTHKLKKTTIDIIYQSYRLLSVRSSFLLFIYFFCDS